MLIVVQMYIVSAKDSPYNGGHTLTFYFPCIIALFAAGCQCQWMAIFLLHHAGVSLVAARWQPGRCRTLI